MKKLSILLFIVIIISSFQSEQSRQVVDIYFQEEDISITETDEANLNELIQSIEASDERHILSLEVFPIEDEALSRSRADVIISFFNDEKIKIDKILFYSEKEQVPDDVKAKTDLNFIRITCEIQKKERVEQVITELAPQSKTVIKDEVIPKWAEPVLNYQGNTRFFTIDNKAAIKLRLLGGSFIEIEKEAFVYEDGTLVNEPIDIITKIVRTKKEAILDELTTSSDEGILESRGMVYTNAQTVSGRPVQLANEKALSINVKTEEFEEDFKAYSGNTNRATGVTNWTLNDNPEAAKRVIDRSKYFFKYKKLSKEKRQEIKKRRDAQIAKWKEMNIPPKVIKKRLRYYRKFTRKKSRRLRKNRKVIVRRNETSKPKLRRADYIGATKYEYEYFRNIPKFYKFYTIGFIGKLGWFNIDRPIQIKIEEKKPPCTLYVKADPDANVKLVFRDNFSIIKGEPTQGGFVFSNIPSGFSAYIVSAKTLKDDTIDYSYKEFQTGNITINLPKNTNVSKGEYKSLVRRKLI